MRRFDAWAPRVGLGSFPLDTRVRRQPLLLLLHEAAINVVDHAYKSPHELRSSRLSYLALSFHRRFSKTATPGSVDRYVDELDVRDDADGRKRRGFVEIVVSDDGAGIAARQAQDLGVHAGHVEPEDAALRAAFESGSSIKLVTHDALSRGDPGYGFTYIADGLRRRRAYAELRTGRRLVAFNGLHDGEGYRIAEGVLGVLPGTILQLLVPVYGEDRQPNPNQTRMES